MNKNIRPDEFWYTVLDKDGKPSGVSIDEVRLIDFCSDHLGFCNYVDYSGAYTLVCIANNVIKEARVEDLKQAVKHHIRNIKKREDVWSAFLSRDYLTRKTTDLLKVVDDIDFNLSRKEEAHFYYKNGVVVIAKGSRKIIPYSEYSGYVWDKQINQRDFTFSSNPTNGEFAQFLKNISGNNADQNPDRLRSLCTIVGYLLHPYKDAANTKAVILLDEEVDFSGKAHGGTGKSLLAAGISRITATVKRDGKKYNANESFGFDDVRPYHRVLYFDDVKPGFRFEDFYSFITGEFKMTRKYKDSVTLPFNLTPKLLISSNYMVSGTGGNTDERRRIEFEIAAYYSADHTPAIEFGHNLFDDWNEEEWQQFDNLMMICVHLYLKCGLLVPQPINLIENKLKASTHTDFVAFMDERHEIDIPLDKAALFADFIASFPGHRYLSPSMFKKWIDEWAESRNLVANHYKSSGKVMVKFMSKEQSGALS